MPLKYCDFKIRFEFISIMTNMKKKNPLKVGYFSKLKKYSLTSLTAQMSKCPKLQICFMSFGSISLYYSRFLYSRFAWIVG